MSSIVAGFATSHASALMEPQQWDGFRERIRKMYCERHGGMPAERPEVAQETLQSNIERYRRLQEVHELIRRRLQDLEPDAVILIGNDQNENYTDWGVPQFAIYTGAEAIVDDWLSGTVKPYRCHRPLALELLSGCVDRGFDIVQTRRFKDDKLLAHAHAQVFARFIPDADIPIIPVFVNAISPPYATPRRCFEFGQAIRASLSSSIGADRVVIGTSGGLSHFTASYPYDLLTVERSMGSICSDFDRTLLSWIEQGSAERVAGLTNQELVDHGDVEFRQGIAFLGALSPGARPTKLSYEPFYRGLMGFWAGYWE